LVVYILKFRRLMKGRQYLFSAQVLSLRGGIRNHYEMCLALRVVNWLLIMLKKKTVGFTFAEAGMITVNSSLLVQKYTSVVSSEFLYHSCEKGGSVRDLVESH